MLNIMLYLRDGPRYLRNQRGIETLEWILIGGLITGVAIVLYPGQLQTGLTNAITAIVAAITTAMP
jgi:Flp pilus assembly pilin Flp